MRWWETRRTTSSLTRTRSGPEISTFSRRSRTWRDKLTFRATFRPGLDYYERNGYLPINGKYKCCDYNAAVSTQEQYNVDDNSVAELASELGENGVAKKFATRAQNWQNVFDPASGFMEPKLLNGAFEPGFGPEPGFGLDPNNGFTETDSFVSTTMIPFDVKGLVDAEGGDAAWIELLNGLTSSVVANGTNQVQMGDEPSFDVPWEYDYVGVPFKTQEAVREIQDQDYADSPTGLAGNDDLGEMSSWYVWSALGAYPENPGSSEVVLGSPLFKDIVFHLGDGGTITENAPAAADNAPYVQNLTVNGASWTRTYLLPASSPRAGHWTGLSPPRPAPRGALPPRMRHRRAPRGCSRRSGTCPTAMVRVSWTPDRA